MKYPHHVRFSLISSPPHVFLDITGIPMAFPNFLKLRNGALEVRLQQGVSVGLNKRHLVVDHLDLFLGMAWVRPYQKWLNGMQRIVKMYQTYNAIEDGDPILAICQDGKCDVHMKISKIAEISNQEHLLDKMSHFVPTTHDFDTVFYLNPCGSYKSHGTAMCSIFCLIFWISWHGEKAWQVLKKGYLLNHHD